MSQSAKSLGLYYLKIAIAQKGSVKLRTAPFDSLIIHGGKPYAFELKSQKVHGSFPLSNIQEHQLQGLQDMVNLEVRAYLLFNMRREQRGKKLANNNLAWGIDMKYWMKLIVSLPPINGKPRQSIPRELFDTSPYFVPIPRVKPGPKLPPVWDIRVILEGV